MVITILKLTNVPICKRDFTGGTAVVSNTPLDIYEKLEALTSKYFSDCEIKKINRLPVHSQVRLDTFWARFLLKKIFMEVNNIEGENFKEIVIFNSENENTRGLPGIYYRDEKYPAYLSISHCDGRVGVAINDTPCGLDIVKIFTLEDHSDSSFINYAFSEIERHELLNKSNAERFELMTLIWGIKEAVSKYLGCGLVYGPATVEVVLVESKETFDLIFHNKLIIDRLNKPPNISYYWNEERTFCQVFVE